MTPCDLGAGGPCRGAAWINTNKTTHRAGHIISRQDQWGDSPIEEFQPITTATNEDPQEVGGEQGLQPIIHNAAEFDKETMKQGMIKEMTSMRRQDQELFE